MSILDPHGTLQRRGIRQAAAFMGWQPPQTGYWSYPIIDEIHGGRATRYKACSSSAGKKYLWGPAGKPVDVSYYHPPGLAAAIAAADGLLYIAAGEPDMLTYLAAGLPNVLSWFGETSVPKTLLADLRALGVQRIIYAPDLDSAGRKSALKVRDWLSGTGIHCEFKQLPDVLGEGGDTNDLWQLVNFESQRFHEAIHESPDLDLPPPVEKPQSETSESRETPPGLVQAIIAALLARGFKQKRNWLNGPCLWPKNHTHGDKTPSFGINSKTGWSNCFGACEPHGPDEVASELGIDPDMYKSRRAKKQHRDRPPDLPATAAPVPDSGLWFHGTLPDSWRSAFCKFFRPSVAPVVELLHELARQGYIDPRGFTLEQVFDQQMLVGFYLSAKTIRGVIAELDNFFPKVDIEKEDTIPKKGKKLRRPAHIYCFAPRAQVQETILHWARPRIIENHFSPENSEQLVTKFEVDMLEAVGCGNSEAAELAPLVNAKTQDYRFEHEAQYKRHGKRAKRDYYKLNDALSHLTSTELPAAPIHSPKDYRALLLRGQVEAGQDHRSESELADTLGVTGSYVPQLRTHAGLANIPQYEEVSVDRGNVHKLSRGFNYDVRGYPKTMTVGGVVTAYDPDQAAVAIDRGAAVTVTYQIASKQIIARDEPLPERAKPDEQAVKPEAPAAANPKDKSQDKPAAQRYYGASFDPAWVKCHLILALLVARMGYIQRRDLLIDTRTGEIWSIDTLSAADVISLLRGEGLERTAVWTA